MTEPMKDIRYLTALASIRMIEEGGLLDLTTEDFQFLTMDKPWIGIDRSRATRCLEASIYGALDYLGLPRFAVPAEFVAGAIAYFVNPVNMQTACNYMEGAQWSENIINGIDEPLKAAEIFSHTLRVYAGIPEKVNMREDFILPRLKGDSL